MSASRNARWYREEADRLRDRAMAVWGDETLRNSYLALARQYERLAETLEKKRCPPL